MSAQPTETPAPTTETSTGNIWDAKTMFADVAKTPEAESPQTEAKPETTEAQPAEAPATPDAQPTQATQPAAQQVEQPIEAPAPDPALEVVQQLGGPEVVSLFTPLFTPFQSDSDPRIRAVGADFVRAMAQADPRIGYALYNGVLDTYKTSVQEEAFKAAGLTPELLDDYQTWVDAGKPLPGLGLPPVPTFPEPDADGFVDLNGVTLDTKDPKDKLTYDLAKRQFDLDKGEKDRQRARQDEERQQREARERDVQIEQAQNTAAFFQSLDQRVEKLMNEAPLNFGLNAQTQVEGMPEAQIPRMLLGLLHDYFASQDQELNTLLQDTQRLAGSVRPGTVNPLLGAKETALARKSEAYIAKSLKIVSHVFSKLGKLQQEVPKHLEAPKVPENVIKTDSVNTSGSGTPPPAIDQRKISQVDNIWNEALRG